MSVSVDSQLASQAFSSRPAQQSLALLYHELTRSVTSYTYAMERDRFALQLRLFRELDPDHYFRPLITFDDGHRSDVELALPALLVHGFTARFFITAGWTGKRAGFMTADNLRTLHAAGCVIGGHSWSHRLLTQCSREELQRELVDTKMALEDHISAPVTEMSLPGGRANRAVIQACEEAGYRTIWTSAPSLTSEKQPVVGRFNVRADHSDRFLKSLLNANGRALGNSMLVSRCKSAAQRLLGDALYARLWTSLNDRRPSAGLPELDESKH